MVRVEVKNGLSDQTNIEPELKKNENSIKKPSIRVAKPKKQLNFGPDNIAIYPICGDKRFLNDNFSLPSLEKKLFLQVFSIIRQDYPEIKICFITTDELEVHNNFTEEDSKKMGERARNAYRNILSEANMIEGESFIFRSWRVYREKADHHIESLKEKARADERLRNLIRRIAEKHISKFDTSDDSKLIEQSENFIYEEYGVTLQWREEFQNLVIIQMFCSSERRSIIVDWLAKNEHFPMEVEGSIRLLTYYDENRPHFFGKKKKKNKPREINPLEKRVRSSGDLINFFRILANADLNAEIIKFSKNFEDFTPQFQRLICEQCSSFSAALIALGMNPGSTDSMADLTP